ncbi:drug/metabolite transporter (DMT)-like permease [Pseudomonas sp. SJZ079]|uniref:DMT family transporter n=1 Tax=Pseudomonas sp. SJZ079 TaxID=2572887 RepID=UPI00119A470C|nr:DMT family transporter [Pseudomonas sp. SJZ079]TWC37737.1 drug/metabolite transporter (DMT)-like permease [Pseudomonas sp. SJZ079]
MTQANVASYPDTKNQDLQAYLLGLISVAAFAMTLPAAKVLAGDLSAVQVGIFRSVIAAFAAIPFLLIGRAKLPNRSQLKRMLLTSTGIVYGFPILTALGMQYVPVSHGGVVLAALPLSTAIFGTLITGIRPSRMFWVVSCLGFLVVMAYTVAMSDVSDIYVGDLALLGAVLLAGFGYAQGGALSKELPGWQVMCWTLVVSLPILLPASLWLYDGETVANLPDIGVAALLFLALINSLLGFFSWNRALALGGIQRISQLQLLQPFFTFAFSIFLMGESWNWLTPVVCVVVIVLVWLAKRT